MTMSPEKRREITAWAVQKATENARALKKEVPESYQPVLVNCGDWFQEQVWHYEKMAYLKIHERDSRMKR